MHDLDWELIVCMWIEKESLKKNKNNWDKNPFFLLDLFHL